MTNARLQGLKVFGGVHPEGPGTPQDEAHNVGNFEFWYTVLIRSSWTCSRAGIICGGSSLSYLHQEGCNFVRSVRVNPKKWRMWWCVTILCMMRIPCRLAGTRMIIRMNSMASSIGRNSHPHQMGKNVFSRVRNGELHRNVKCVALCIVAPIIIRNPYVP